MSSLGKPIVLVCNVLSAEGASVIETLLKEEHLYKLRGVVNGELSHPLVTSFVQRGVDIITLPITSDISVWEKSKVFDGVFAVYAMTSPHATISEHDQAIAMVNAAKSNGVKMFIWSSFPDVLKESGGKYNVPYWTEKAEVAEYIKSVGFKYCAFLMPSLYFQNLQSAPFCFEENSQVTFLMPDISGVDAFDVRDTGPAISNLLRDPDRFNLQDIPLAVPRRIPQDYVKIFNEIMNKDAKVKLLPINVWERETTGSSVLAEIFRWSEEFGYFGKRDRSIGQRLLPKMHVWLDFLDETNWSGPNSSSSSNTPKPTSQIELKPTASPHLHRTRGWIVILGANGFQGRSVINALCSDGNKWKIRALVYDINSISEETKQFMFERQVDLRSVNLDEVSDLKKAFKGAYAIFTLTLPEYKGSTKSEIEQCKLISDVAKDSSINHFIWSHKPHFTTGLNLDDSVVHRVVERRTIADYIMGKNFKFVTYIEPAIYYNSWKTLLVPSIEEEEIVFTLPEVEKIVLVDPECIGSCVRTILNEAKSWSGMDIPICSDILTPKALVKTFATATNKVCRLIYVSLDEFARRGKEYAVMAELFASFSHFDEKHLKIGKKLYPAMLDWRHWLEKGNAQDILNRSSTINAPITKESIPKIPVQERENERNKLESETH